MGELAAAAPAAVEADPMDIDFEEGTLLGSDVQMHNDRAPQPDASGSAQHDGDEHELNREGNAAG